MDAGQLERRVTLQEAVMIRDPRLLRWIAETQYCLSLDRPFYRLADQAGLSRLLRSYVVPAPHRLAALLSSGESLEGESDRDVVKPSRSRQQSVTSGR